MKKVYKMIKYKVLDEDLRSPFQGMKYKIGKEYISNDFDSYPPIYCSRGYYATDLDGILYSYRPGMKIFECEVVGKESIYSQFKQRFEKIKLTKELSIEEIKKRMSELKYDWNVLEATFPINPFEIEYKFQKSHVDLVRKLDPIGHSFGHSVDASFWTTTWYPIGPCVGHCVGVSLGVSVRNHIEASVRGPVRNSVRNAVWAYISSLFPGIKKWKYIDHPEGENPFQPAIDLWKLGAVISYDGKLYRIHSKNGIEWEGEV